jgi:hypothetical protein
VPQNFSERSLTFPMTIADVEPIVDLQKIIMEYTIGQVGGDRINCRQPVPASVLSHI